MHSLTKQTQIILVTGIASAAPLVEKLHEYSDRITHLEYSDHHDFTRSEIAAIEQTFSISGATDKLIITTEKDAARLTQHTLSDTISNNLYVLPIEVVFLQEQQEKFNHYIIDYVSKNSRNRIVHQRAHAHKS